MRENDLVMAAFYLLFSALNPKNNIKLKSYFFLSNAIYIIYTIL